MKEPIEVTCTRCNAKPGESCMDGSFRPYGANHAERVATARAVADIERPILPLPKTDKERRRLGLTFQEIGPRTLKGPK